MGTYAVAVTRCESATIYVGTADAPAAEALALGEAESSAWEPETVNTQVDDISELTDEAAASVSSSVVREEEDVD